MLWLKLHLSRGVLGLELIVDERLNSLVLHSGSARKYIHTCCQPFLHDAPNRKKRDRENMLRLKYYRHGRCIAAVQK